MPSNSEMRLVICVCMIPQYSAPNINLQLHTIYRDNNTIPKYLILCKSSRIGEKMCIQRIDRPLSYIFQLFVHIFASISELIYPKINCLFEHEYDIIAINLMQLLMNIWRWILLSCTKMHPWSHFTVIGWSRITLILSWKISLTPKKQRLEICTKHTKFNYSHKHIPYVTIFIVLP